MDYAEAYALERGREKARKWFAEKRAEGAQVHGSSHIHIAPMTKPMMGATK